MANLSPFALRSFLDTCRLHVLVLGHLEALGSKEYIVDEAKEHGQTEDHLEDLDKDGLLTLLILLFVD